MGCSSFVPRKFLMCMAHWRLVDRSLQQRIRRTIPPVLTANYRVDALRAVTTVAVIEGILTHEEGTARVERAVRDISDGSTA